MVTRSGLLLLPDLQEQPHTCHGVAPAASFGCDAPFMTLQLPLPDRSPLCRPPLGSSARRARRRTRHRDRPRAVCTAGGGKRWLEFDDKAGTAIAERNVVPIDRSADLAAAGSFRVRRGGWRTAPAAIGPLSRCGSAARPRPLPARPSALRLSFSRGCHAQGRTKLSSDATRRQRVTFAAVGQMERLVSQKSTSLARCGLKAGQ